MNATASTSGPTSARPRAARRWSPPRVLVIWAMAGLLLLGIVVLERRTGTHQIGDGHGHGRAEAGRVPMFEFGEGDLGAIELFYEGRMATLMRDPQGAWFRHDGSHLHSRPPGQTQAAESGTIVTGRGGEDLHRADPTDAAELRRRIEVSLKMLADRRIQPEQALQAYGLANPSIIIAYWGLRDGAPDYARPLSVLYVGDMLPTRYAYYAMRDGDRSIALLPRYQIALLLGMAYGEENAPTPLPDSRDEGEGATR
ncbi:MAG: hypothetical protein KDK91_05850 [Gammaproteobacteria bacterium]|nr:hypothetical protein [Gammaproteobacteria bacterium]